MKPFRTISRLLVGFVFVFSGFVKGVDPLGTAYRIEDYFIAYGFEWAMPWALLLSILLCALEFLVGVALLLNLRLKHFSWILLILMSYFTLLTFYDALNNPVPDCGCFGDAIKLTNWQTFYKNLILMVFVIAIFISRKKFKSIIPSKPGNTILLLTAIGFSWFSIYQYDHLPMIDFRDWKVGADLNPDIDQSPQVYLIFKNKNSGETKEYLSPDYPWKDSVWMSNWEFVDQRVMEPSAFGLNDFHIEDLAGDDMTSRLLDNPNYQFLIVAHDLNKVSEKAISKLQPFVEMVAESGYAVSCLTASLKEDIIHFSLKTSIRINFYNADDILLKTMIRANPGIILLKDGVIMGKWHYNNCPDFDMLIRNFQDF